MKKLPLIHPGEILQSEFLEPMKITPEKLAEDIDISIEHVNGIIEGEAKLDASLALRLERYFRVTAQFWINLQNRFDLEQVKEMLEID